jgi:hypothetical protein
MLKPKLRHLRDPRRTLGVAKSMVAAQFAMRAFAGRGDKKFRDDPRYDLKNVTAGFASRQDIDTDDTAVLNRICAAYKATVEHPSRSEYRATGWWQQIRERSLGPVRQALLTHDIAAVRRMYSNFFRDPCSAGLAGVPYGMTGVYFGGKMTDLHRRFYLADILYRLDYWQRETEGRFCVQDLAIPRIGNPFGVCLEDTLVSTRAEFHHRYADRVAGLLESRFSTVVEIGGGFGAMAYYLLRDRPETKYLDFDLPESIALATYYLLKAFPQKEFLLFGEAPLTSEAIANADVVLMPLFAMNSLPTASTDLTFSSHSMTDIEAGDLATYLEIIHRVTRDLFLFVGAAPLPKAPGVHGDEGGLLHLEARRKVDWSVHRLPEAAETEELYSFNRADKKQHSVDGSLSYVNR